jgi:predicted Zn-dependent protease
MASSFLLTQRYFTRLLSAVLLVFAAGCDIAPPDEGPGEGPGHRAQQLGLRPDQELELGKEAYRDILSESRNRILPADDPQVRRVRTIGSRIIRAAGIEPLQREINLSVRGYRFEWEANVIEEDKINAFCLPGGKIVVYTGILPVAQNDDQLATVISHEIAHALAHHSNERVTRSQSGHVNFLVSKAYDRRQESEADHIGVFLMTFAGYDPQEAVRFWVRMSRPTKEVRACLLFCRLIPPTSNASMTCKSGHPWPRQPKRLSMRDE